MLSNTLSSRIQIQKRAVTQSATGATIIWRPIEARYGEIIPLSAKAKSEYQQLNTEATHRVIFRDSVSLNLADYRMINGSKVFQPVTPPTEKREYTEIVVKEI